MSGGYFDYEQIHLDSLIEKVKSLKESDRKFTSEDSAVIQAAWNTLTRAKVYIDALDLLLSQDIDEKGFKEEVCRNMLEYLNGGLHD